MEGDTPSFLWLIGNGLASHENPSWGGWGGRYVFRQPYGESRALWTQGGDAFAREWSRDTVIGIDGDPHTSNQATIWRWREAFQHDFAARMDWTVKSYRKANHNPRVRVNGVAGEQPVTLDAQVGKPVTLDAGGSSDPDGDRLRYSWFFYPEAGAGTGQSRARVTVRNDKSLRATVTPTSTCPPFWLTPGPVHGEDRRGARHPRRHRQGLPEPHLLPARDPERARRPGLMTRSGLGLAVSRPAAG
jgi:hypothetical protein